MVPDRWRADFRRRFEQMRKPRKWPFHKYRTEYEAMHWLEDATRPWQDLRLSLNASDGDICALADRCAAECMSLAVIGGDVAALRARQSNYCERWGVAAPSPVDGRRGVEDRPAIARMTDAQWWRRGLRRVHARALEGEAIRLGYVHRRAAIYCSDETLQRRTQQRARNAAMLENTVAQNEYGDEFTLAELAARSVANPAIRRGELMTRIAGFEAVAKGLGHVADFVTATCPSRMHSRLAASGDENPRYDGTTPRQAQAYLSTVWARVRAAAARQGVAIYGFRIAEPHHDGCPHWHMIFFMESAQVEPFRELMHRYFLADSPDEPGARANRVKFVPIDPARGSAAGYVAKYVAKNIDGFSVGTDLFGTPALEASARVEAWAGTWGIRQFQQVGGPPVGVWRELRRVKGAVPPVARDAHSAADVGNWGAYTNAMGGPLMARKDRPLGLAYAAPEAVLASGEIVAPVNRYGEEMRERVCGVLIRSSGFVVAGLRYVWRILSRIKGQFPPPWTRVNNCTGVENGTGENRGWGGGKYPAREDAAGGETGAGYVERVPAAYPGDGGALCGAVAAGAGGIG